MVLYIFVFLLILEALFLPAANKKYEKLFLIIAFVELQFVSGFKVASGGDAEYYVDLFVQISQTRFKDLFEMDLDKGFLTYCYLISFISTKPQAIIFITSAIINVLVFNYINKYSRIKWLSVVLYVTFMYFFNAMNLLRFVLAYTILLYSHKYIVQRKLINFLLILCIAGSFHFSTFLYGIIYFIYPLKLNLKTIIIIGTPFVLASIYFMNLFEVLIQLNDRYVTYGEFGEFYQSAYANILQAVISIALFLFCVVFSRGKLQSYDEFDKLGILSLLIAALFSILSIKVMMIVRFVTLFSLISIVTIPNIISHIKNKQVSWICILLFLLVTLAQTIVVLEYRSEWYFEGEYKNLII